MSDRVWLSESKGNPGWADVSLLESGGDMRKVALAICRLSGPYKVIADDPGLLLRFMEALKDDECWLEPENFGAELLSPDGEVISRGDLTSMLH